MPKGRVEEGETDLDAAVREVGEEVGIYDLELIGFVGTSRYSFLDHRGRQVLKTVVWYAFLTASESVHLERGFIEAQWMTLDDALSRCSHSESSDALRQANRLLTSERYNAS